VAFRSILAAVLYWKLPSASDSGRKSSFELLLVVVVVVLVLAPRAPVVAAEIVNLSSRERKGRK